MSHNIFKNSDFFFLFVRFDSQKAFRFWGWVTLFVSYVSGSMEKKMQKKQKKNRFGIGEFLGGCG